MSVFFSLDRVRNTGCYTLVPPESMVFEDDDGDGSGQPPLINTNVTCQADLENSGSIKENINLFGFLIMVFFYVTSCLGALTMSQLVNIFKSEYRNRKLKLLLGKLSKHIFLRTRMVQLVRLLHFHHNGVDPFGRDLVHHCFRFHLCSQFTVYA